MCNLFFHLESEVIKYSVLNVKIYKLNETYL